MNELVASLVGNLPFAVVLVYFLWNYFKERKETLGLMKEITVNFTDTIRTCCEKSKSVSS